MIGGGGICSIRGTIPFQNPGHRPAPSIPQPGEGMLGCTGRGLQWLQSGCVSRLQLALPMSTYREVNKSAQPRNPGESSVKIHRCGQVPHRAPGDGVEEQDATSTRSMTAGLVTGCRDPALWAGVARRQTPSAPDPSIAHEVPAASRGHRNPPRHSCQVSRRRPGRPSEIMG